MPTCRAPCRSGCSLVLRGLPVKNAVGLSEISLGDQLDIDGRGRVFSGHGFCSGLVFALPVSLLQYPAGMSDERARIVAGCMTGTSLDGLDVALVRIVGTGLAMKAELIGHHALSMFEDLRSTLMSLALGEAAEPLVYMRAARALGELHADALEGLLAEFPGITCDFVTAHGQTIWHAPRDKQGPKSWQLFDPWPIVRRLKLPVCYDLRQADLIAGGEGAPLTPIADWVMYREHSKWVVNLGGVMNMTGLADALDEVRAGDVGPCNLMLDGLCRRLFNQRYDKNGELALGGKVDPVVMAEAFDERFGLDHHGSMGREQYSDRWLDQLIAVTQPLAKPADILRTACHRIALSINTETSTCPLQRKPRVVLAGGGARNQALVKQILEDVDGHVILSDDLGIPCEAREAMGFVVLGALSQDGVPISLPQVTGAVVPGVAGVWTRS